jgi:hypothetical protein
MNSMKMTFSPEQIEKAAICDITGLNTAELDQEIKRIPAGSEKSVICTNNKQVLLLNISKTAANEINVVYADIEGRRVPYMEEIKKKLGATTITDFNWSQQARDVASMAELRSGGFQVAAGVAVDAALKQAVQKRLHSQKPESTEGYSARYTLFGRKTATTTPTTTPDNKITIPGKKNN